MKNLLVAFKDGYPPLDVAPLDPYRVGAARFEYAVGPLSTKVNLKDAVVSGASKLQIKDVRSKINDRNAYMELDITVPKLITESDFKGRSTFNGAKVRSDGHVKIVLCKF